MKKAPLTKKQQERAAVLLAAGYSQEKVAKEFGMSESTFTMCLALTSMVVTRTLMPVGEYNALIAKHQLSLESA